MRVFLFIIFIVTAAAVDGCPVAGAVCLEALIILSLLSKRKAVERRPGMGYKICPHCGAYLDPDEKCDCRDDAAAAQQENSGLMDLDEHIKHDEKKGGDLP